MPTHPEDLELVSRIVNGDEDAANEFGRVYSARFEYLARKAGVPAQDCQDVAQEALLAAISQMRRGLFRGESSLGTWLEKIVRGKIAEYGRSRGKARAMATVESLDDPEKQVAIADKLSVPAVNHETVLTVQRVLKGLPLQYRMILLMNLTEGYTIEEISRAMDLTVGQVSKRLYKAQEMFRRLLREGRIERRMIAASSGSI